ncbi:PLB2 [Candida metapsilosis]|uniref:Lysophospholipase n=1 Tax=Candida metapsilosis TaxID=273372 RepID=A0A8H7ZDB7_9ASCO|nr:PLB2 [Candida metapsilosis]
MLLGVILFLSYANSVVTASDGYAPVKVKCPGGKLTRPASTGLNENELAYMGSRYPIAKKNLAKYLHSTMSNEFGVDSFLAKADPTIGIAFSGGGYRALLTGAGEYAALDERIHVSHGAGLGGILQSSSYISGLSGGAWLVGSIVSSNLISIDELIGQNTLWQTTNSILNYFDDNIVDQILMWIDIGEQVRAKQEAGFSVSITDVWGRALSYQFWTNKKNYGAGYRFSDVMNETNFRNHYAPFPILVAVGRVPDTTIINLNSTVFSFTPFEVGSESPYLNSFVKTKSIGTLLDNGYPKNSSCINGFDNVGFFIGTSSSLFNAIILSIDNTTLPDFLKDLINETIIDPIVKSNIDVAKYNPNAFYKSHHPQTPIESSKTLYLVDGGEDGQNVPLVPLLKRNVSVVFAFDNSADNLALPDGTSLIKTYERQFSLAGENTPFPYVPGQETFLKLNLTSKPTFFGCNADNLTSLTTNVYDVPLVIYIANKPYSFPSNTSTFKLSYSLSDRNGMITNGFEVASMVNGTLDTEWRACVGCAVIRREQERLGLDQTDQCNRCFEKYCWDGSVYGEKVTAT